MKEISYSVVLTKKYRKNAIYPDIYSGTIEVSGKCCRTQVLDAIFRQLNVDHPEDYHRRSLSVGDVVILNGRPYRCNGDGWSVFLWDKYPRKMKKAMAKISGFGLSEDYSVYSKDMSKQMFRYDVKGRRSKLTNKAIRNLANVYWDIYDLYL